jgi:hypothetical protein
VYFARGTLRGFVSHAFHRGIVFVDGHGRRESAYRPAVLAFYPVSVLALAAVVWKRPLLPVLAAVVGVAAAAAAARKRRPVADVAEFALLAPVYAVAHGLGMWRALTLRRR